MVLAGVLVNAAATALGGVIGALLKKGLPERFVTILNGGLGLCVLYVGISGALKGQQVLVAILSIVIGGLLGELINLDKHLKTFGAFIQRKLTKNSSGSSTLAEGFVSCTMFVCVGAMAIVGSLESGLNGNHEVLYTKALLDFVSALIMGSALGFGVCLASVVLLVYQGALTLCAEFVAPLLSDTVVCEMTCVGSLLIIAIATNLLKITDIKVSNLLPAAFLPIVLCMIIH